MLSSKCGFLALVFLFALGLAGSAAAQEVSAVLADQQVTMTNGIADVACNVEVTNGGSAALANLWVVFENGAQVNLGDVAGGATARSERQVLTIDLSQSPTHNQPVPVTLRFQLNGESIDKAAFVVVRKP